jgi:hypothetical protein
MLNKPVTIILYFHSEKATLFLFGITAHQHSLRDKGLEQER